MKYQLSRGILIAIEGIDGSGKSTLLSTLAPLVQTQYDRVVITKEPGATALGKHLRALVQEKKLPISTRAEFLLFASDRAQHFDELIIPALAERSLIISDRMTDSSLVYQGFGRGLPLEIIQEINAFATQGRTPDLILYLHVNAPTAISRIFKRNEALTSFEREMNIQKLLDGYQTLFQDRDNVITLDGMQEPSALAAQTLEKLHAWLQQQGAVQ